MGRRATFIAVSFGAKVREKFQLDGTAEETDAEGEPEVLEDEE